MKKLLLLLSFVVFTASVATAQENKNNEIKPRINAIGVRLGYDWEASFQRYLSDNNRLEANFGYAYYGTSISATYQWVWALDLEDVGFNWYAGVGAGLGSWISDKYDYGYDRFEYQFGFGIHGQIGIEYNFKAPIAISLDWRPIFQLAPDALLGWEGFALGVRYRF